MVALLLQSSKRNNSRKIKINLPIPPKKLTSKCVHKPTIAFRNLSADVSRYGGGGGRHSAIDNSATVGPFHYGSHYSNTGVVLHYLLRLPPFTSMFLEYQDGHFDLADRVFQNLDKAWCLASGESSSDVKELIPDMFYLPGLSTNFYLLPPPLSF